MTLRSRAAAGGRTGQAALAAAAALVLVACGTAVSAARTPGPPQQPSAAAAGTVPAASPTTAPARQHLSPVLPRSLPLRISIPSLGVQSRLASVGIAKDGSIQVPAPGPEYDLAAWYRLSPTPGERGPAVIEGHVDSAAGGPSVFYRLGALRPGSRIEVTRADGRIAVFTVQGVRAFPKNEFPTGLVYGNTPSAALRVITCGGGFDRKTGHYRDNVVAFATLSSTRRA